MENQAMMRVKAVVTGQSYRQQKHINVEGVNHKAARIAGSSLSDKAVALTERWGDTLTTYCDYFIRY